MRALKNELNAIKNSNLTDSQFLQQKHSTATIPPKHSMMDSTTVSATGMRNISQKVPSQTRAAEEGRSTSRSPKNEQQPQKKQNKFTHFDDKELQMLLGKSISNTKAIDKRKLVEVDSDSDEDRE